MPPPSMASVEGAGPVAVGEAPDLFVEVPELLSPAGKLGEDAEDRTKPHSSQAAAAPTRAAFRAEGVAIATGHPSQQGVQVLDGNADMAVHVPLNTRPFEVETDLFKGVMQISVRGVPTTPAAAGPGGPLECSRRTFHVSVQGRFKRPMAAEAMLLGMEFPRAPPTPAFTKFVRFVFNGAAKVFANTTDVHVPEDDGGYFHFPCFAAAEYICVSRPGEEPPLLSPVEDLTLWDPALVAKARGGAAPAPLTPSARKRFFDVPANLAGRVLDTEHVWTFQLHQSLINFATYKCGLPGMPLGIDLAPLLSCQPLQIMAKDEESGSYLFNILIWNESLLYPEPEEGEAAPSAVSKVKDRFTGMFSGW